MYKLKYFVKCMAPLLAILPLLGAAELFFSAFYIMFNAIMLFFIISSAHNLFNKQYMIRNMALVDIAASVLSTLLVFAFYHMQFYLYTGEKLRGILILIFLNQLFMYSRYNYKERAAVRKGIY